MSYTKGPWGVEDGEIYTTISDGSAPISAIYYHGISDDGKADISERTGMDNARLISAAPELLEALEECVEYVAMVANTLSSTNVPIAAATEQKARAAIAKAKA